MSSNRIKHFACMFVLSAILGCGDGPSIEVVPFTGKVTYNGDPVSGAVVTFTIEGAPLATGVTNSAGEYSLKTGRYDGAPIGTAKVGITKASDTVGGAAPTETMTPEDMQKMQMAAMNSKTKEVEKPPIPLRYSSPATSGLVANVTGNADDNYQEFPLAD